MERGQTPLCPPLAPPVTYVRHLITQSEANKSIIRAARAFVKLSRFRHLFTNALMVDVVLYNLESSVYLFNYLTRNTDNVIFQVRYNIESA